MVGAGRGELGTCLEDIVPLVVRASSFAQEWGEGIGPGFQEGERDPSWCESLQGQPLRSEAEGGGSSEAGDTRL